MSPRYVTRWDDDEYGPFPESTPLDAEMEDPESYRLYSLCPCENCNGTGKVNGPNVGTLITATSRKRCPDCRGEGRTLSLVATCGSKEAVGVALVTLADEGHWDDCKFGLMHRPEGEKGHWILNPWAASPTARNLSDAGRVLRTARQP